jgi:hypothetical protein
MLGLAAAAALAAGPAAASGGTRAQHREWIYKHVTPRPAPDRPVVGADASGPAPQTRATRRQHRDWARKFETAGGSVDGARFHAPVGRSEADVRQLLRCGIEAGRGAPDRQPLVGC